MPVRGSGLLAKTGLAAACLLPPAAAGIGFRSWFTSHQVAAVVLLLGYAVLVAAVGFAGRIFGGLQSRWAERLTDVIDRRLRWKLSRFERAYRAALISRNRFVDLKGLATRGDYAPGLAEVFIDVSLVPRPAHETSGEALAGRPPHGTGEAGPVPAATAGAAGPVPARQSLTDFLGAERGTALAVIGAPGTGKTTLLKHVALRPPHGRYGGGRGPRTALPVLLFLRDHAAAITERPDSTLPELVRASLRGLREDEPEGWFEQQLAQGRCVVLLDGLDEVAREEDRRAVAKWVEEQIEQYETNDFVLTSRPHGYLSAPLNRARVLQVRRFTSEQVSSFVHGWYHAIEKLSTGVNDAGVADRAAEEATDLLERLRARPVLYDLATNPLLLTMIANVHRYRGALPGSRADLYREICEVLLWRRHQAKNPAEGQVDINGAKTETVLRELAYHMMTQRLRDISAEQAGSVLRPALYRVGLNNPVDATAVFLDSVTSNGLLVERERGLYAFAHLTLQEHLAALHIQQHGRTDVLTAAVDDDWWRETALLYAARTDPAPVIAACLAARTPAALALAFDCAEAATEVDPGTVRELEELREQALIEPLDSPTRRLMTAVTVTRLLRETVQLNDDTVVCSRPVTRELYRLFAAEREDARYPGYDEGDAAETAAGMSRTQALAFVGWVNSLLTDGPVWTLPTRGEVEDPGFRLVAQNPEHAVWCAGRESIADTRPPSPGSPGSGSHLTAFHVGPTAELWVPQGRPHPWEAQIRPIAEDDALRVAFETGQLTLRTMAHASVNRSIANDLASALRAGRIRSTHNHNAALVRALAEKVVQLVPPALDPAAVHYGFRDLTQALSHGKAPVERDRSLHTHRALTDTMREALRLAEQSAPPYQLTQMLENAHDHVREAVRLHHLAPLTDSLEGRVLLWSCAVAYLREESGRQGEPVPLRPRPVPRPVRGTAPSVRPADTPPRKFTAHPDELSLAAEDANRLGREVLSAGGGSALEEATGRLLEHTLALFRHAQDAAGSVPQGAAVALEFGARMLAAELEKTTTPFTHFAACCNVQRHRASGAITPSETIVLTRT
ncbi:NACHT domain-containing protein [Streptomyces armeniacus]|uniref:NACHT domain-containing protein n=1 Tax=Streptomyces armeniacus TaxID=83291 RepID=A0A345XIA5_9ACTN|nr:NACHT domain-containing protein [Streptomyces armeniacus]AXK31371.1 NACHT domain-containing protein [Streptomyces armeniacus]